MPTSTRSSILGPKDSSTLHARRRHTSRQRGSFSPSIAVTNPAAKLAAEDASASRYLWLFEKSRYPRPSSRQQPTPRSATYAGVSSISANMSNTAWRSFCSIAGTWTSLNTASAIAGAQRPSTA